MPVFARNRLLAVVALIAMNVASLGVGELPASAIGRNRTLLKDGKQSFASWPPGLKESNDVNYILDKVLSKADNSNLPFIVIDKKNASVYVYDRKGRLLGSARTLLGLAVGDFSVPDIGRRSLRSILPDERTTPAGRFVASVGRDFEQDVLWIDYDAALSLHRVITGEPADRRSERLASPGIADKRISYGCVNVPREFYDMVVRPAVGRHAIIVYILPELQPIDQFF